MTLRATSGTRQTRFYCGQTELETQAAYDRGLQAVVEVTGLNGEKTAVEYDGLGRMTKMFKPDPVDVAGNPHPRRSG